MSSRNRVPYSLIRYHYDAIRGEPINIGILLQTRAGIEVKIIDNWERLQHAYSFIDVASVRSQAENVAKKLNNESFTLFDYEAKAPITLPAIDSRVPDLIMQLSNGTMEITSARYAELASQTHLTVAELALHLYERLVVPPERKPLSKSAGVKRVRRAHATLHRAAHRNILKMAKDAGLEPQPDPSVQGKTKAWQFDLKLLSRFVQHILVLPDIDETIREAAALARIWQDVLKDRKGEGLTAVFYPDDGANDDELAPGVQLLTTDNITPVHFGKLRDYYSSLASQ